LDKVARFNLVLLAEWTVLEVDLVVRLLLLLLLFFQMIAATVVDTSEMSINYAAGGPLVVAALWPIRGLWDETVVRVASQQVMLE